MSKDPVGAENVRESLNSARSMIENALQLLDSAGARADVGALLQEALERLDGELGEA